MLISKPTLLYPFFTSYLFASNLPSIVESKERMSESLERDDNNTLPSDDTTVGGQSGQASDSLQIPDSPTRYSSHSRSSTSPIPIDYQDEAGKARQDGLPRSQSGYINTPATSTTSPYSSLQYAPRQKPNALISRASQSSFQSHSSLWKQQQQQQRDPMNEVTNTDTKSPSLLSAFPNSTALASSPVLSTLAIEGLDANNDEQSSQSNADQISAAERLAKQQLRADAEDMGVRVGSLGWAILDRIQSAPNAEWAELGEMLSRGEATLLLPTSPLLSKDVNLSQAYNHIVFSTIQSAPPNIFTSSYKGKGKEVHSLLTFKGLRAELIDDEDQHLLTLQFKSFLPRENMKFVSQLKSSSKRIDLLNTLSTLPLSSSTLPQFPFFRILGHYTNVLLPPSLSRKEQVGGSIRLRASSNGTLLLTSEQKQANRASATFATLFGGRRDKRASFLGNIDDDKESKEMSDAGIDEGRTNASDIQVVQPTRSITVAVIDGEIRRSQVLFDLTTSLKSRIKQKLTKGEGEATLSNDIVEVICSFATIFIPPTSKRKSQDSHSTSTEADLFKSPILSTIQAPFLYSPDQLADSFQDFYSSIKVQLEESKEDYNVEQVLQQVETIVCSEVYDRIFCPFTSLDSYHDEALSSRIDTLNGVGITLHQLGLDLDTSAKDEKTVTISAGLEDIVKRCGSQLQSLGDRQCCSPSDKLDVLVSSHKVIVENLAKLPKIDLIDEGDEVVGMKSKETDEMRERRKTTSSSTSSADLILPILIYCIIRSNPPRLASNLLYIQRYHAEALIKGEASYCLVNVQAAVAFLENVEPASLNLPSSVHLVTASEVELQKQVRYLDGLSPTVEQTNTLPMPTRLRDRVAHDVGELAGMSNRVITGVLGSSLGAFGRMMGAGTNYAMGIDASTGTPRTMTMEADGRQKRQKSIEDIRGILSGGGAAAAKLGSVLNKVVAMENEGKASSPKDVDTGTSRPKPITRRSTNSLRPATDYGIEMDNDKRGGDLATDSVNSTSSKTSITDRLASLPLLSRTSNPLSLPPPPPLSTRADLKPPSSPTVPSKDSSPKGKSLQVDSYKSEDHLALHSPLSYMEPTLHYHHNHHHHHHHIPASLQSPFPPLSSPPTRERPLHVVLASTGSVASVKVPLMVEKILSYNNVRIQIISTRASSHFYNQEAMCANVNNYTVKDLANEIKEAGQKDESTLPLLQIWTDEDEWNQWEKIGDSILHIELRRWADIVLIAPCSANTLAKINAGICDDLLVSLSFQRERENAHLCLT